MPWEGCRARDRGRERRWDTLLKCRDEQYYATVWKHIPFNWAILLLYTFIIGLHSVSIMATGWRQLSCERTLPLNHAHITLTWSPPPLPPSIYLRTKKGVSAAVWGNYVLIWWNEWWAAIQKNTATAWMKASGLQATWLIVSRMRADVHKMGNDRWTHPPLINICNWIMRLNSAHTLSESSTLKETMQRTCAIVWKVQVAMA